MTGHPVLEASDLVRRFDGAVAVDRVSLSVAPGQILGVVGESGAGKTTLARCLLGLLPPTSGTCRVKGREISKATPGERLNLRSAVQGVFQDPLAALNPRYRVRRTVREPLDGFGIGQPADRDARVDDLLREVGLDPALAGRLPHELSGGQRQRVCLARALAPEPELVVLDEPVTALDVSVQARILQTLRQLRSERGVAFLLISHDLAVVQQVADHVAVMHAGRLVEYAAAADLFSSPAHPYTRALLLAVPTPDPRAAMEVPPATARLDPDRNRCMYAGGCPEAFEDCRRRVPADVRSGAGTTERRVQCLLFETRAGQMPEEPC